MPTFANGESAASVRTKINDAINKVDGNAAITSVNIDGGSIDGTTIGAASAAAGTFTTVTASGDVTIADKIVHDGDTNTAIRFPAADTVTVETGGVERMRITSAGLLGIGTSSPSQRLDVRGTAIVRTSDATSANNAGVLIQGTASATASSRIATIVLDPNGADSIGTDYSVVRMFGDGQLELSNFLSTGFLTLNTNSTERMRITSTGNVGIGTAAPAEKLVVEGATPFILVNNTDETRSGIRFADLQNIGERFQLAFDAGTAAMCFDRIESTGVVTERMRITATGNVGIGTTSPATTLDVNGDVTITDKIVHSGDTNTAIRFPAADTVTVETAGSERMRIDSSGNVGLGVTPSAWASSVASLQLPTGAFYSYKSGTTSNFYMLTNAYFNGTNNVYVASNFATQYLQSAGQHIFYTAPSGTAGNAITFTQAMTLDASGNLGIGTTSPAAKLQVEANGSNIARFGDDFGNNIALTIENASGLAKIRYDQASDGAANKALAFFAGTNERVRITSDGNLLIGGTTAGTASAGNLVLYNGTAPTGNVTNGITLYAEDVSSSSELKVRDEAGNVTTLSPHNFDLIPEGPSEEMAWSYYSERDGKRINVDMLKAIRLLEQITGEKLVHIV